MNTFSVSPGTHLCNGQLSTWEATTVDIPENLSWFRHRVDLVVMSPTAGVQIIQGELAFWKGAPPTCSWTQIPLASITVPSKMGALWARLWDWIAG